MNLTHIAEDAARMAPQLGEGRHAFSTIRCARADACLPRDEFARGDSVMRAWVFDEIGSMDEVLIRLDAARLGPLAHATVEPR